MSPNLLHGCYPCCIEYELSVVLHYILYQSTRTEIERPLLPVLLDTSKARYYLYGRVIIG